MSWGSVALTPRAPAGHLPAGLSPQGAAISPGAWLFIVRLWYLRWLPFRSQVWGLLYGNNTVQTNCRLQSASIFFPLPLLLPPSPPPSPSLHSQHHHYLIFLQRSEAAQCDWEADSPAEGPPSLLSPGKGDFLKGTKTYQTRFKPWNFAGNFLGFCSKAGMIPTEHGTFSISTAP